MNSRFKNWLRVLVCMAALDCNALPALANFAMSPSGSTTMFAIDGTNQGTSLCAAASTECAAHILINTAGAPIGVAATPLQVSIANTGANATAIKVDGSAVTQPVSGTVTATQATAASLNATVVGTGTFATQSTLSAETTKVIGTVRNLGNAGAITDFVGQAATAPANSWLVGATFFTTPTTLTNGQASPLQMDNAGNLLVNIKAGAGSGGTAIADAGTFTAGTTSFTPIGGQFTSGGATACVTGHACWAGITADRAVFTNIADWAGGAITAAVSAYGTAPTGNVPGFNTFVTNTNANGQATMANSSPVVLASNQSSIPVTVASGGVASGAIASGALASGSVSSGAFASGSIGSGAIASGAVASGAFASGAFATGSFLNATAGDPCMFQAKTNVAISTASGTVALVTGVSAKKIYVCSLSLVSSGAISVSLAEGSSSTCGTSAQAAVLGVATNGTAANGIALAANGGLTLGNGGGTVAATATNANYLCLFQSGTTQMAGNLTYVQQ